MKRFLILSALCVFLVATAFGQGTIKIGGTWPLADVTGEQGSKAAQLAVDEINKAGGVLGRKLQLIIVDDELKADKGVAAIEKLVTVDKVDFLMGGMASGVALGQVPTMKSTRRSFFPLVPQATWWSRRSVRMPIGTSTYIHGITSRAQAICRDGTISARSIRL